jgi:hypothetical protein
MKSRITPELFALAHRPSMPAPSGIAVLAAGTRLATQMVAGRLALRDTLSRGRPAPRF